ncbi:MAG: chemotaxis protein CheW [Chloroflexi bacterium]|nr:chemotaxis protein CheW [Chloroflexota bacterium]
MTFNAGQILVQAERAAVAQTIAAGSPALPVITFAWGKDRYALPVDEVREIAKVSPITPMAGLPPTLLGAMNLRGEVLTVADLRPLLDLEPGRPTAASRLILVTHQAERVGLLVDAIGDIFEITTLDRSAGTAGLILGQAVLPDGQLVSLIDLNSALRALADQ